MVPGTSHGAPPQARARRRTPLSSRAPRRTRRPSRAPLRWQLVGVGLAAVVLHVAVVWTAVEGLRHVEAAHADVADIVTAQRHFQDADMAHDAMRGDALMILSRSYGLTGPGTVAADRDALEAEVDRYRTELALVDQVDLPSELEAAVRAVRPLQERYAADAEAMAASLDDPAAAEALFASVEEQHEDLVEQQQVVTELMSAEGQQRRSHALADERAARWRVSLSAAAALAALLGLTFVLHRMGRTVSGLLARERGVAETLQQSLLPDRLPDLPGARFAARYLPGGGGQVGGDWYDVIDLPGGCVGLVMGDVVGHDVAAAAAMGQVRNALLAYAAEDGEPEDVLQRLNRLCLTHGLGGMATVVYAVLDPVSGTARVASAGHYPPLLVCPGGSMLLEPRPGPPVGAVREPSYSSTSFDVPAGSLLALYTDGLVERREESVDRGLERLRSVVRDAVRGISTEQAREEDLGLEQVCDAVLAGMLDDDGPVDDVALLLVSVQTVLGPHLDLLLPARAERLAGLRRVLDRWAREVGADDEEAYDIVVASSEAATNAVEHAYGPGRADFRVVCDVVADEVTVVVRDWGRWREARGTDRGRGTGLMRGLMDGATVTHGDNGTEVVLRRRLAMSRRGSSRRALVP